MVRRSICSGILGLPQSRPCENDQSVVTIRPTAPACRARSTRCGDHVAPARPVDLEEQLRVGGDHVLDRLAGERRQSHRRAARRGRAGHGHLAVRIDRLHTGRRDDHRQRNLLSHNGCRHSHASRARRPHAARNPAHRTPRRCRRRSALFRWRPPARHRTTSAAASSRAAARWRPSRTRHHGPRLDRAFVAQPLRRSGGCMDSVSGTGPLLPPARASGRLPDVACRVPVPAPARRNPGRTPGRGRPSAGR